MSHNLPWFALRVATRYECRVSEQLALRQFEPFLPLRRVRRRWSDRIQTLEVPLFPGYLFSRFDPLVKVHVLNVPGVAQIVGLGNTPAPVSEAEIEAIKVLIASRLEAVPHPYLRAGQTVRIERGPLAGVEGRVLRAETGRFRIVVSVSLLQRSVATEIDRDWIALAG